MELHALSLAARSYALLAFLSAPLSAVSPSSGVGSSPRSSSPVPPASTSITVSPTDLSSPLSAVSPCSGFGSSGSHGSPGGISTSVSPASSSAPIHLFPA